MDLKEEASCPHQKLSSSKGPDQFGRREGDLNYGTAIDLHGRPLGLGYKNYGNPLSDAEIESSSLSLSSSSLPSFSFFSPFRHDPDRIEKEKAKHKLTPFSPKDGTACEDNKFKEVKMGEIRWLSPNALNSNLMGLFTKNVQDCIAVVFKSSSNMGLGHVSMSQRDYALLEEELQKLTEKNSYEVYLVSHYFSKNLENVVGILKSHKMSIKGVDVSDNFAECDEHYDQMGPIYYRFSSHNNMQAQNTDSRAVYIQPQDILVTNASMMWRHDKKEEKTPSHFSSASSGSSTPSSSSAVISSASPNSSSSLDVTREVSLSGNKEKTKDNGQKRASIAPASASQQVLSADSALTRLRERPVRYLTLSYLKSLFEKMGETVTTKGKKKKIFQMQVKVRGQGRTFNSREKKADLKRKAEQFLQELTASK